MSKAQFYDPKQLRAPGEIHFQNIDVCKYQKTVADELKGDSFTKEDMLRIYRDMEYIREFESMLKSVRLTKAYNGVEYTYTGPAHLYTGEESAAVGQSYLLDSNDFIFGTHRSHGEVLAKGLSAITKMSDEELLHIMETTFDGKPYEVVKKHLPEKSVKEQAIVFFLYGLTCELFGRENGFARGLGNSMHLFFLPFGIYPNNAIVGGSPCIAAGAALYKKNMKAPGVVIANGGDGSLGCGPVWEALNFSAMDQLKTLWPDEYKGGLPVIFNFMDNGYGMGGRTNGETMAYGQLARVGAGITENPLAVIDAYRRKLQLIKENKGPVLLDVLTYRLGGHSTSDQNAYRSKEEIESWEQNDCILLFRKQLIEAGVATDADIDKINEDIKTCLLYTSDAAQGSGDLPPSGLYQGSRCHLPLHLQQRSPGQHGPGHSLRADAQVREPPGPEDRQEGARRRCGRQARVQAEAVHHPRRHLRGHYRQVLRGSHPGLLR